MKKRAEVLRRSRAAIASNLQLARTLLELSQDELGSRCGLHRTHLSAIERKDLNVGLDTLDRIARALGIPVYVLFMPHGEAHALLLAVSTGQRQKPL